MWDMIFAKYAIFLLVFVRVTGMIVLNPFFIRKSVPVIIKVGLSLIIAIILTGIVPNNANIEINGMVQFMLVCVKELFIGFLTGFVMQMFLSVLTLAGNFVDLQLGISMAQIYDTQSNVSMPLTSSIFNLLFAVLFFVTNAHLTFFKIIFYSFDILPLGTVVINANCGTYVAMLFSSMLMLAVKLAFPIVAIEIVAEMGLGVVMRAVPQINVFAVGMQLKLLVGVALMVLVFPQIFGFMDNMIDAMFKSILETLKTAAA